jgi:hypothetical protein
MRCLTWLGVNIPRPCDGDVCDWLGGVCGGVECVEAAEAFLERVISVESEAVDTFCRLRGGAISCRPSSSRLVLRLFWAFRSAQEIKIDCRKLG